MTGLGPWTRDAACKGHTELFYSPLSAGGAGTGEHPPAKRVREAAALELCARCPVVDPCLRYALEERELGIWGGTTESDRARAGVWNPNTADARVRDARRYFLTLREAAE